ncbi:hypothetical protein JAAARDRAFT_126881 [Jaapia argillacea MUCL 33604]|uniref:Uncharacterized protein n=1 Tax=Jaapia argillacea MUCL 33604 TaxID=933084 RepID=A0A067QAT9_9AGAM|nr:hypothetical protein JAAARDRAFT_126881 [Jaapia argillacea MUCL 33604]
MSSCDGIEDCRTVWTIIWSCLVTVMACTWVAIHLNVPSPREGFVSRTLRRIGVMMMAVVLPEFVVGWAARQYIIAGRLAKDHEEDHKWTRTHGFFALMGGFMLYDGDRPIRTLTPVDLETLVEDGSIDFPSITEEEIKDRSKGDALSKGVALIHTTWFTVQVIARGFHRLPTTELELVTLAFTVLNVATYWLWWSKPLGVQCPFRVPLKSGTTQSHSDSSKSTSVYVWKTSLSLIAGVVGLAVFIAFIYSTFIKGKPGKRGSPKVIALTILDALFFIVGPAFCMSMYVVEGLRIALVSFLGMGLGDEDEIGDGAMNVPSFYAGKLTPEEAKRIGVFILPAITIAFGAIHCIAWEFDFPTHVEQRLWRMAAATITCAPVVMFAYWAFSSTSPRRSSYLLGFAGIFAVVVFFFYITCRITLLALALSSLRSLPHGVFQTIAWTEYIPHL